MRVASIVKRGARHHEPYDERKLYASIYASCLAVRCPVGSAEITAERVCQLVAVWLAKKHEVTAADIRRIAASHLAIYHPDAAYLYKHHRLTM